MQVDGIASMAEPCPALSPQDWHSLRSWHRRRGRHHLPWRLGSTPWRIMLAEVLLHRTRASKVESLYNEVVMQFPSPVSIVRRQTEWLKATRSVGLIWRSRSFVLTCEQLVVLHGNEVPRRWSDLTALPGVGHYIASSVRCFGFGVPEVVVDTNTIRLACRVTREPVNPAQHRSRRVRKVVARLSENGRASQSRDNYALLDLAALVCHSRKPACDRCPLLSGCVTGRHLMSLTMSPGEHR